MSSSTIISGSVHGPKGAIADARVYFVASPGPLPDIAALTDSDGFFLLTVPDAGNYKIRVSADGFAEKTVSVDIDRQKRVELDIELKPDR
ncbi:MAG TPA: carboxypeptidase-like regulatory domain-containing protein [Pyrinomonadaceae bacterium]|jgi:hypothetical protein